jgi:hypothetical protein
MLIWNVVRLGSVVAVLIAIITASSAAASDGDWDPSKFYAYFTIQSNLIGVVALIWAFRRRNAPKTRAMDLFRGAAAAYLTVTFFVTILFLSEVDVDMQVVWIDAIVHRIFPLIVVLDWIIDPPGTTLRWRDAVIWLVYPLVWLGATLARGASDGWYPYPFLDPANGGYASVGAMVVVITIGFLVLALSYIWLGNWRSERANPSGPPPGLEEPRAAAPPMPPGWETTGPEGPLTPP